ncbi:MAG: ATP-binding protein [Treponema sp.]|nr:ATP-binding protein [Treponema sp.]
MLLNFSCSNVRSIRDKVTLDLRANSDDTFENSLIRFENERVNPACAIYGSNATGKTSVLTGMAIMQSMVLTSHILQPGSLLNRAPHRLSPDKPTEYEMEFVWKKTRYIYSFSYDTQKIIKETLYYAPNGRMGVIFSRDGMKVKAAEKFSRIESMCKEKLIPNKLVLSLAVNNLNYEELSNAYLFYSEGLVVLMNDNNNWLEYSVSKMEHDKKIKDMFLKFLRKTGSDIVDIKPKSEQRLMTAAELPPDMPPAIRAMILNQPVLTTTVKTIYKGFSLELIEESMGTQKLIKLMCPIMDIFQKGKTFVCDEIECHLHPLIVRQLVGRFIKGKVSDAQIICATHDVEMLDLNLFRRDQIYFTDINPDYHRTTLKPLSSYQCRKDENVQRKYLESKYCRVAKDAWEE